MPSTPPPTSRRARTPPTPFHGPQYDNYTPYSPRRSTRSTAQSNPYSSLNTERSPQTDTHRNITPPTTAKKARFARPPTQLSSPPSSPASPVIHRSPRQLHNTPKKSFPARRKATNGALSDSDHTSSSLALPPNDPVTMLPTPSKTPKKRQVAGLHSTARILDFHPNHPNDVMPSPRQVKKQSRHPSTNGFGVYHEEITRNGDKIEIYTDANARVPEIDEADDNPFVGRRKNASSRPQRRSRKAPTAEDLAMEEAVQRDDGVVYVFRGKRVFRKFEDVDDDQGSDASNLGGTTDQRMLKRKAGASAQRPLTRSSIKPRLLFPPNEQHTDEVDEEAVTDIEMPSASSPIKTASYVETPRTARFKAATPPPTTRPERSPKKKQAGSVGVTPTVYEDEPEPMSLCAEETTSPSQTKRGVKGPFDTWQRTKVGRKRAGEASEQPVGSGKRTRSAAIPSPI